MFLLPLLSVHRDFMFVFWQLQICNFHFHLILTWSSTPHRVNSRNIWAQLVILQASFQPILSSAVNVLHSMMVHFLLIFILYGIDGAIRNLEAYTNAAGALQQNILLMDGDVESGIATLRCLLNPHFLQTSHCLSRHLSELSC
jgi:hypothetical protein